MSAFDSIVLIAFGRPEKPEAHHYELISGCSPLNELTFRQAEGLRYVLRREGIGAPVYVGMRNWMF